MSGEKVAPLELKNIFRDLPQRIEDEVVEVLAHGKGARIERIVSRGHRSPEGFWYDQAENEWVILLSGRARLTFQEDGRVLELRPGDHLGIPAHTKHRVEWTDPERESVWLAVFY